LLHGEPGAEAAGQELAAVDGVQAEALSQQPLAEGGGERLAVAESGSLTRDSVAELYQRFDSQLA